MASNSLVTMEQTRPWWFRKGWPGIYGVLVLLSIALAVSTDNLAFLGLPAVALVAGIAILDYKQLYLLLLFFLPLSIEIELPGGLATDLPTEPLMWLITACLFVWLIRHWPTANMAYLRHPITILLAMHFAWIGITTLTSHQFLFSFKFLLAKVWYLAALFVLPVQVIRSAAQLRTLVWAVAIPLLFTIIYVSARHATHGFSFEMSNEVMDPFYRNHVIYACFPAIFIPFLWFTIPFYKDQPRARYFLMFVIFAALFAINFAYTRAAYVALAAAAVMYYIVKWRLTKLALAVTILFFSLFVGFVTRSDNYMLFAPDFSRTITHKKFENLLEATTKLEDISTMERVYRWVAAAQMIQREPWIGYGPGNFYSYYQRYTVTAFTTYVSDNPERSGIHNYYLMTLVEQGLPGFLCFLALCFYALILGERAWHALPPGHERNMVMAATQSMLMLVLLMLMNDLVETDKLGTIFFLNLAILVSFWTRFKNSAEPEKLSE
jgi:O-antigen ligase